MNPYIQSLRLRTLPLSVSGIILGTGLACLSSFDFHLLTFILAICTTLSLQILSNLCNELGDAQKGTDADQHGREAYGLQAGTITEKQIRGMILLFAGLAMVSGLALLWAAFGSLFCTQSLVFIGLGALAIIGAITYTLGKHSYGYIGLGDLGVFLFFGLLSTIGSYYLQTQTVTWEVVWCGIAIGFPCVGVLNLNNIRDMKNDRVHGKHTFASWLGQPGARVYHTCLLTGCLSIFALYGHWWTLCILPVWTWHLWYVWSHGEKLDKQMPVLMFSTLIVSILALI
jgi:1,4-dihydroxy-2-naphthoate octaprenyltransferase